MTFTEAVIPPAGVLRHRRITPILAPGQAARQASESRALSPPEAALNLGRVSIVQARIEADNPLDLLAPE